MILALILAAVFVWDIDEAQADGRYSSVVTSVAPDIPGLEVSVVGSDEQMRLANRSGKTVAVVGYDGDQVGRVLADRTVEVNLSSPSYWTNQERMGGATVPRYAKKGAVPRWRVLNKTGVLIWHDHRIHWMGVGIPPSVKDKSKRTRVWNYKVPIIVQGKPVSVNGTLWWVGQSDGVPTLAIGSVAVLALLVVGAVLARRRRQGLPK